MNLSPSEQPLIVWPCYEPAGCSVTLSESDLLQHILVLGSTGSGKTTLMIAAIQQLIQHQIGLLILDAKPDGTVALVTEAAAKAGRKADVAILGPEGTHALDLFGALHTYDDVETLAQWLMLGTDRVGGDNPYWHTTTSALIGAALTLLLARRNRISFGEAIDFMRNWFVRLESSGTPKQVTEVLEAARRKAFKPGACPQLRGAVDMAAVWKDLDWRTRSNLQSCLLNVLRPLMSTAATRTFDASDRPAFHPSEVATAGRICVVSANALTHPELTAFLLRLARRQFFDAVQSRSGEHPLCGVVADEFALIVRPEDADQVATLRSRKCFFWAMTQSLSAVDYKVGLRLRQSILLNFASTIWMRTREIETGEHANMSLGEAESISRLREDWSSGILALLPSMLPSSSKVPVCPMGALGRLQPHQAYVMKSDGTRTLQPVWFVPWFELATPTPHAPPAKPLGAFAVDSIRTEQLMERCGFRPKLSPRMMSAALTLDARLHDRALSQARLFFAQKGRMVPDGLESLPASWLAGLRGIMRSMEKSQSIRLAYTAKRLACSEGVLLIEFAQESPRRAARLTPCDAIRVKLNRCLYPTRWRELLPRHLKELLAGHPGMRGEMPEADQDLG